MELEGYSNKAIQESLGLKHMTHLESWWRWYRKGEHHRFHQPVGKQYTYGKGPEGNTPEETLTLQNKSLKQQIASFHASLKCETFELNPELKSSTEIVSNITIKLEYKLSLTICRA